MVAVGIAWLLFVPTADWLAYHDVGSIKGALHETALDNARDRLLTLGAGLFAAGALWFTARNVTLSRRTVQLTEQGQVTDRYTRAIEQVGSDMLDVRLGGIYALERVARDSARDYPTVMEVLAAFIREHSREKWPPDEAGADMPERSTRPDVQAAVTVIGRRRPRYDPDEQQVIDFTGANLTRANLTRADPTCADVTRADLTGANLIRANLKSAQLRRANLTRANLTGADLTGADLTVVDLTLVDLTGADFFTAHLAGANLASANLTDADLIGADFSGADLACADLSDTQLGGADLTGAFLDGANLTLADLDGAELTNAHRPEHGAPVPDGWVRDPDSGRLQRVPEEPRAAT